MRKEPWCAIRRLYEYGFLDGFSSGRLSDAAVLLSVKCLVTPYLPNRVALSMSSVLLPPPAKGPALFMACPVPDRPPDPRH